MPAAFWNLRYGERYDVTHPVNLRRLLRDIADGGILGCMITVPCTGWNVARCCDRPLRSSAQPWRIEKSRVSLSLSDQACLGTNNRIMRIGTAMSAFQCTVGDRESRNVSLLDELSKMRNAYKRESFDFCGFGTKWRKRTTVPAGYVDSADVWALDTMRCRGRERCSFTGDKHMQLVGYGSFSSMFTYTQKQNLSDETGKQTRESSLGTHPHRPNAENML